VLRSSVERDAGSPLIVYDAAGDGFLRHMVRNIVGTLVEIGRGRWPAAWIGDVLASRDRAAAGPTAPAQGLFLMAVVYDEVEPAKASPVQ
jgi:tRNA pseudouridine38-40 synthase